MIREMVDFIVAPHPLKFSKNPRFQQAPPPPKWRWFLEDKIGDLTNDLITCFKMYHVNVFLVGLLGLLGGKPFLS